MASTSTYVRTRLSRATYRSRLRRRTKRWKTHSSISSDGCSQRLTSTYMWRNKRPNFTGHVVLRTNLIGRADRRAVTSCTTYRCWVIASNASSDPMSCTKSFNRSRFCRTFKRTSPYLASTDIRANCALVLGNGTESYDYIPAKESSEINPLLNLELTCMQWRKAREAQVFLGKIYLNCGSMPTWGSEQIKCCSLWRHSHNQK